MILGTAQCFCIFFIAQKVFTYSILNQSGQTCDLWVQGVSIFTTLIFVVNNKLALTQLYFDFVVVLCYIFPSYVLYIAYLYVTDPWTDFVQHHYTWAPCFGSPVFYLTVLLTVAICFIGDYLLMAVGRFILTDTRDVVRTHALSKNSEIDEAFI